MSGGFWRAYGHAVLRLWPQVILALPLLPVYVLVGVAQAVRFVATGSG